jgi:ATP/maltotriose-dependent transcriptional regulator MalT
VKDHVHDPQGTAVPEVSPSTVPRRHLMDRLGGAKGIALVSGVPASGRTTLVASWAHTLDASVSPVYWIAASAELAAPSALWNRLLGASDGTLDRFARALAASGSSPVVVLDDADTYLTADHVAELVELVRRVPESRVVIIGHVLPELPASVAATRMRARELQVSADELAAIAESAGVQLPRMAVDVVRDSFQGWLTPSMIAVRTMADALADGRAPEHAFGLAMETATAFVRETFERTGTVEALTPLWLWQCADELTAETARVAIGIDHPHRLIARLEDEGAVRSVPDASPPTWTVDLGPVLAGMLVEQFAERFAEETRAAHRRLSSWLLERGDESRAVSHAIAAEDWSAVTDLLSVHWSSLLSNHPDTLRASMNALPQHFLDSNPRWVEARNFVNYMPSGPEARPVKYRHASRQPPAGLMDLLATLTSRSAALRFSGQFDDAALAAAEAEDAVRGLSADELGAVTHVLPELRVQWAISFELAGQGRRAREAFEATFDEALERGNPRIAVDAAGNLALIAAFAGLNASASGWLARMPHFMDDEASPQPVRTTGSLAEAIIALDKLDIDEARTITTTRVDGARSPEQWAIRESILGQLSAVAGDARARLATLRSVLAATDPSAWSSGVNRWIVLVAQADLLVASGQASAALALLDGVQPAGPGALGDYVDTARARAALFSGESERAVEIVMPLVVAESTCVRTLAELLLLLSAVDASAARTDDAGSHFRSALDLIETHGLPLLLARIPRDSFETLVGLPGCRVSDETLRLVRSTNALTITANPAALLSPRERDVLRRLVAGASVDEIASEQFVTRNTVKTQVRSIYRKLGTTSREETIRVARTISGL